MIRDIGQGPRLLQSNALRMIAEGQGVAGRPERTGGFEIRSMHRPKFRTGKKGRDARPMPRYDALVNRVDQSLQFRTLNHANV